MESDRARHVTHGSIVGGLGVVFGVCVWFNWVCVFVRAECVERSRAAQAERMHDLHTYTFGVYMYGIFGENGENWIQCLMPTE